MNKKKILKISFVILFLLVIVMFTVAKDYTINAYNLVISGGNVTAEYVIGNLFGENITSGTVDEARIDGDIARDIELIGNCSQRNCDIGWGNLTSIPEVVVNSTDATIINLTIGNSRIYHNGSHLIIS